MLAAALSASLSSVWRILIPSGVWAGVIADLISAAIGGLLVFIARDHVMRLVHRWWRKHAGPALGAEVHVKIGEVHELLKELRAHIGNGFLDDVHLKLDEMEDKFRNVIAEDVVPLLAAPEVLVEDANQPSE